MVVTSKMVKMHTIEKITKQHSSCGYQLQSREIQKHNTNSGLCVEMDGELRKTTKNQNESLSSVEHFHSVPVLHFSTKIAYIILRSLCLTPSTI
jgi:hypothetical protein